MKRAHKKLGVAGLALMTVLLIWQVLSIPYCQANDDNLMDTITNIDVEPAIPTVGVLVDTFDSNNLNFTEVIAEKCARGAEQGVRIQGREPMPDELDHIYVNCMIHSGAMF